TQADPWQSVIDSHQVNDVVTGRVTKVVTFGAFVEIHPGVEGLVHISELAAHHVENPREVVNQGDEVAVRIIEIDADRRRLSLSLKRVSDSEALGPRRDRWEDEDEEDDDLQHGDRARAYDAEPAAYEDEEELASDEPVAEEPVAEEPIAEEPVAEEPVAEEPEVEASGIADEPEVEPSGIADEPEAGEPA